MRPCSPVNFTSQPRLWELRFSLLIYLDTFKISDFLLKYLLVPASPLETSSYCRPVWEKGDKFLSEVINWSWKLVPFIIGSKVKCCWLQAFHWIPYWAARITDARNELAPVIVPAVKQPRIFHVGFVVDELVLWLDFLQVIQFCRLYYLCISDSRSYIIGLCAIQRPVWGSSAKGVTPTCTAEDTK